MRNPTAPTITIAMHRYWITRHLVSSINCNYALNRLFDQYFRIRYIFVMIRSLFFPALLLVTTGGAIAQEAEPNHSGALQAEQIIVSGNRVTTPKDAKLLRRFTEQILEPAKSDQLARWNHRVCPEILGVRDEEARFIRERIAKLAADVGLHAADDQCNTTLLIAFSLDAATLARSLTDSDRIKLKQDGYARWRQFRETDRPVRWLTVTDFCSEGCVTPNSRLSKTGSANFQTLIVIVDHEQIGEFQIGELTDYLAMVSLAAPELQGPWPSGSVLAMFDAERHEAERFGLTDYDLALLRGLYASRGNAGAREQIGRIVAEMTAGIDPSTDPRDD